MKKQEVVYKHIACGYINGQNKFTQLELADSLGLSLSTINNAISNLEAINAVRVNKRNFEIIAFDRLLLFWATKRRLENDIIYKTRVDASIKDIENRMPDDIAFTCYTAYKLLFKDVPADYSEVYVYATDESLKEIKNRFKSKTGPENLIVLKTDDELKSAIIGKRLKHSSVCEAQLFVDLWNLKAWYAKDFINALEKRLGI